MPKLRETLDETQAAEGAPTVFRTELNKHEVRCGICDELYYVDAATYERMCAALEFDPTDNPFRCVDCEEEYDEEALS